MNVIVTANSPGELYGWARPLAIRLKADFPECRIILLLLPCAFSSGNEKNVAGEMSYIDFVVSAGEYIKYTFFGFSVKAFKSCPPDIIVHLGGDLFHSALLSRKLNIPAIAYEWANKTWDKYFVKYIVSQDNFKKKIFKQGIDENKVEIVGNLVADGVLEELDDDRLPVISGHPVICFMPGSREREVRALAPFFVRISEIIKDKLPEASFILALSPFVSLECLKIALSSPFIRGFTGSSGEVEEKNGKNYIKSSKGTEILLHSLNGNLAVYVSDFLVSIPGTKTLEAAFLGKPMMVVLPFNRADLIPYFGFIGLLDFIPFLGPFIKGRILLKVIKTFGFTALPNILSEKEIVPEVKGFLTPEIVAEKLLNLLEDKIAINNISEELKKYYASSSGASERSVKIIKNVYEQSRL